MASQPTTLGTASAKGRRYSSRMGNNSSQGPRHHSVELPARFKNLASDDEEMEESNSGDKPAFVGQSMYGLIAGTQGQVAFGSGFAPEGIQESESEGEDGIRKSQETIKRDAFDDSSRKQERWQQKKLSESKLLRSFRKSKRNKDDDGQDTDPMTQSQILPPRSEHIEVPEGSTSASVRLDAPVMDRKLQARIKAESESPSLSSSLRQSRDEDSAGEGTKTPVTLPQALAQIFDFVEAEEVIAEYPCWYLQNVLLQGYLYITAQHICFYAYLQRKGNSTLKSGNLSKRGKTNPRFRRYWFILRGDVLSYYEKADQPYFPRGSIDLRFAITAELAPERGQQQRDATAFTISTDTRMHNLRADSAASAKEWVRQLQKVIFRSHNDGDSVKISIPIANVVDVEETAIVDFAPTVKLSVVASAEDFEVDELFFTFFSEGANALRLLQLVCEDSPAKDIVKSTLLPKAPSRKLSPSPSKRQSYATQPDRLSPSPRASMEGAGIQRVRATLAPVSAGGPTSARLSSESRRSSHASSRSSVEHSRSSFERRPRSSGDGSERRQKSRSPAAPRPSSMVASTESFVTSSDPMDEEAQNAMSASQMLVGDKAFDTPTLRMPQPTRKVSSQPMEQQSERSESPNSRVLVQPPSNTQPSDMPSNEDRMAGTAQDAPQPTARPSVEITRPPRFSSPFQQASNLAGFVRGQSKRMGSYLSSSPMMYYDKVSGAIAGGKRHYLEPDALAPEDSIRDPDDQLEHADHEKRFREHFALPPSEKLVAVYYGSFHRVLPLYGKIYIGSSKFCFRSLLLGTRTKIVIPLNNIDNVEKERGIRLRYAGMVLVIRGHEEIFFDFRSPELRDDCVVFILRAREAVRALEDEPTMTEDEKEQTKKAMVEKDLLHEAARDTSIPTHQPHTYDPLSQVDTTPLLFDDPEGSILDFKPAEPMRITCLTIGSRGDVQPYIALCRGLLAEGHRPKIATHAEFEPWIRKYGIDFAAVGGNPAELMALCVEKGMFTPGFLMETNNMRGWLEDLLESAWHACQGSDLLIESPSAMCGIHIAEALGIPYFRAFTMPWTRTRAYPHAFAQLNKKVGGQYNLSTYYLMENVFWRVTAGQINRWRRRMLGIGPTSLEKMQQNKVPFLYNFSPSVVVPPLDFSDWIRITGYWFLDEGDDWTPPEELGDFISKARADGMKLVYIGFGSVVVRDSKKLTQDIVNAVVKADVRCILSKGWSDRLDKTAAMEPEVPLPDCIFQIGAVPHDWLFKQIDACVHHGGAGTTGASLRWGVPTIAKPFFGDQYFFATRIEDLGVGLHLKAVTENKLGRALWIATRDDRMRTRARLLGERIRSETGVQNAINAIYRDLEYAKSLIKRPRAAKPAGREGDEDHAHDGDDEEESWTFIEPESGVEDLSIERHDSNYWAALRRSRHDRQGSAESKVLGS